MKAASHLRATNQWAGPERHLWELKPGLLAEGFHLNIQFLVPEYSQTARPVLWDPLDPEIVPDGPGRSRFVLEELKKSHRLSNSQIIHCHGYKANHFGLRLASRFRLPAVATYHLHTESTLRLKVHGWIDRLRLRRFDAVITVSSASDPALRWVQGGRLHCVPNGIDVDRFLREKSSTEASARDLGLDPDRTQLLFLGRLTRQKGLPTLFNALTELRPFWDQISLLVVGSGSRETPLKSLVNDLGLNSVVRFLGARSDVASLLQWSDLVVIPSLREGLPYVALEAMACGRAIIASEVGGLKDLLREGSGRLVPPGQSKPLARALRELIETPQLRRSLGRRAEERVRLHYGARTMAQRVAEIYRNLLRVS